VREKHFDVVVVGGSLGGALELSASFGSGRAACRSPLGFCALFIAVENSPDGSPRRTSPSPRFSRHGLAAESACATSHRMVERSTLTFR